jgi:hypothetical protein
MCPNAGSSDAQTEEYLQAAYPPLAVRINAAAPGADLTVDDIFNIMLLCPFETAAKEKLSQFCDLFTEEDWEMFEYSGDLDKYYNTGFISFISSGHHSNLSSPSTAMARLSGLYKALDTSMSSSPV